MLFVFSSFLKSQFCRVYFELKSTSQYNLRQKMILSFFLASKLRLCNKQKESSIDCQTLLRVVCFYLFRNIFSESNFIQCRRETVDIGVNDRLSLLKIAYSAFHPSPSPWSRAAVRLMNVISLPQHYQICLFS